LVVLCVNANIANNLITGRTVTAPSCSSGSLGCSLTATDYVNNNNAQQTNISTVRVDTTGGNLKASFTYQGANVQNDLVTGVSAAADVSFIGVYEWHDADMNNIPVDSEMSNPEAFTVANRNWQSNTYGTGVIAANMAFSSGLDFGNFTIDCYIVKNFTLDVPPDQLRMTGYGSICRIHVTKNTPIAAGNRIALKFYMNTVLPGGSVDTTPSTYVWSIFTTATANRLRVGETWIQFSRQAQPTGAASSTVTAALGPFIVVTGQQQSVYVGMLQNGTNSYCYDVAFEPVNLVYNGATSTTISLFVLLAMLAMACFQ